MKLQGRFGHGGAPQCCQAVQNSLAYRTPPTIPTIRPARQWPRLPAKTSGAPGCGRQPSGEQDADFDARFSSRELKKQRQQDQGGGDEEKAESNEQAAEILRLRTGGERLFAHRQNAKARRKPGQLRKQVLFNDRSDARPARESGWP